MTEPRLRALADCPEAWEAMAGLMRAVWPDWYGPDGQGDALADLRARAGGGLPHGWIAFAGAEPVGTVALATTSFGALSGEGPWLIGLATAPDWRGRGIGGALIRHVMSAAPGPLYTTTREAAPLFARLGWKDLRGSQDGWRVMVCDKS